jgi:hypothetical protein
MIVNCGMKKKKLIQERNEYSPQLSKLLYNLQLKKQGGALIQYFEGLSEDGGRADFSKNLPRLSL